MEKHSKQKGDLLATTDWLSDQFQLYSLLIRFIIKMILSASKRAMQPETAYKQSNNKSFGLANTPNDAGYFTNSGDKQKYKALAQSYQKQLIGRELADNIGRLKAQQQRQRQRLSYSRSPDYNAFTSNDLDHIILEHNAEVQTLLHQISKLQGMLFESERLRQIELQRLKQQHDTNTYLQLSNLKHSQYSQAEVFELQIRKMKEQLNDKTEECQKWESQYNREKQYYEIEKNNLKEEVRNLIQKKNVQILQLKQGSNLMVRSIEAERDNQITQLRYACDRELNNVCKNLQKKQMQIQRLKDTYEQQQKGKIKIVQDLQLQKEQIQHRYERRLAEQHEKYQNLRSNLNKIIFEASQAGDKNWNDMQMLFNSEYSKLFALIRTKDSESTQLRKQMESIVLSHKIEQQTFLEQNSHLKSRIKQQSEHFLQQIQLLKVKIALLHENDLKQVKQIYELKLSNALDNVSRLQQTNSQLREQLHLSSAQKYEMKKKFEVAQSESKAKMLRMKMGMSSMQSDFKEKMQNQKSLMLMTSRSFIKEAELKSNSNKFLEEELRKLRQLMDLQTRENQNAEKAVEEKIITANNELERLSNKIVTFATQKKELEGIIEDMRTEKDEQIRKFKTQIKELQRTDTKVSQEIKIIEQLRQERNNRLQEILILKDRVAGLESSIKEMQAEYERCQLENQINQEEAKNEYHIIAESHLSQFKKFYEEKIRRAQDEKQELKKIIGSQCEQITELIRKYRELEESMKEAVRMMKRRTELQEKVINLGMDTNLVWNMSQLLPH